MDRENEIIEDLRSLEITNRRRVWKPFMEKYDCQRIVELGVFEGFNFNLMIEHNPELAVGVDLWLNTDKISQNDSGFSQERLDKMSSDFLQMVYKKPFVHILREDTVTASQLFPDNYFDLIYIDADHTYEGCLRDIKAWYPKIKSGGFVTGDDYGYYKAKYTGVKFGVKKAVNEFFSSLGLTIYELPRLGWAVIKP